jgi:hypothetical protein
VGSSNQPEFTSRRLVYVGAGGQIMVKAFSHIMELLALIRRDDRDLVEAFRIELYGTGEAGVLSSVASRFGLCDLVSENPGRISYSRSIELALAAAGLFVFGVDDPAYMPSKLFTYSLTGKPLLVCTRQDSQANSYFQTNPGLGDLIHFGGSSSSFENDRLTLTKFLVEAMKRRSVDRSELLRPFLSSAAARRHAELFDECSNPQST